MVLSLFWNITLTYIVMYNPQSSNVDIASSADRFKFTVYMVIWDSNLSAEIKFMVVVFLS